MRDLFIMAIAFSATIGAFWRPYIGLLGWIWFSLMYPHRLTWGFSYSFNFVDFLAAATLASWLLHPNKRAPKMSAPLVALIAFFAWTGLTTIFAVNQADAFTYFVFTLKILILPIMILLIAQNLVILHAIIWMIVVSIGFYAMRGGIFTIITGGNYRVFGPPGSFFADNNELALATITIIPLIYYLMRNSADARIRTGLKFAIPLALVSALGSYSRGAIVGLAALGGLVAIRTNKRFIFVAAALVMGAGALVFLPETWHERMNTFQEIDEDSSAQGRLHAWGNAIKIANASPLFGAGHRALTEFGTYERFNLDPPYLAAHSIVFQVLAEHGYVGLALYLLVGLTTFFYAQGLNAIGRRRPDMIWASDLGFAAQASLVGFFASGIFLSRAYFELIYAVMAVILAGRAIAERQIEAAEGAESRERRRVMPQTDPAFPAS